MTGRQRKGAEPAKAGRRATGQQPGSLRLRGYARKGNVPTRGRVNWSSRADGLAAVAAIAQAVPHLRRAMEHFPPEARSQALYKALHTIVAPFQGARYADTSTATHTATAAAPVAPAKAGEARGRLLAFKRRTSAVDAG